MDLIFYLGLALLFTHELDAIHRHEWRIFPFLRKLRDQDLAYRIFVAFHIPLFVLVFWLMCHPSGSVRYWFQLIMDFFFILHLGLHQMLKTHKQYQFTTLFSKILIHLLALLGLVHLVLLAGKQ